MFAAPRLGMRVAVSVATLTSLGAGAGPSHGPRATTAGAATPIQEVSREAATGPCAGFDATIVSTAGLRCLELLPTRAGGNAHGLVDLGRVDSPFGVAVTPEGHQRYRLTLRLDGLPDPAELGAAAYVAWATTPLLRPIVRLGVVGNGVNDVGEVAFDKFLVWVTAENDPEATERGGPLVLRGGSPSTRMHPEDLVTQSPMSLVPGAAMPGMDHHDGAMERNGWSMPPMHPAVNPIPGMTGLFPDVAPWLPGVERPDELPLARPRQLVRLEDGGDFVMEAGFVRRQVGARTFVMLGFNGQIPGPLVQVPHAATVSIRLVNRTSLPLTIHWHGIRIENRFDGVPGLTQEAVQPGESFDYRIVFPDAGIYWYHPHHREDVSQDLGLYGNLLVDRPADSPYDPVDREEVLMLDDLLIGPEGLVPYGLEASNFVMMGRFGNVFLVNGEPDYGLDLRRGEVVRFYLTNVSNTRTFNVGFSRPGSHPLERVRLKVIGTDVGRFEHQEWAESVVIAPAERYIVEAYFPSAGEFRLRNEVRGVDHRSGGFFPEVSDLGTVRVSAEPADVDRGAAFAQLRAHPEVVAEVARYRAWLGREPDLELGLRLEVKRLPLMIEQLMALDRAYFNPVEWAGTMPMMNWATSTEDLAWHLVEPSTGRLDGEIDWRFAVGDVVKIRVRNERYSFHAMQHPIHIHGQRFLILEQDGVPSSNLAWKDTFLAPVGSTTDILLEVTNPGRWMIHCHIAEHLSAGMKTVFEVQE